MKRRLPKESPLDRTLGNQEVTKTSQVDELIPSTGKPHKIMKCQKMDWDAFAISFIRKEVMVGTFNVRTAREGYKRLELVTQFLESGMEIIGI